MIRTRRHPVAREVPVRSRGVWVKLTDENGETIAQFLHPDGDQPGMTSSIDLLGRRYSGLIVVTA
jgi:hypothetical protein